MKITKNVHAFVWEGLENNCNSYYFGGDVRALIDVGHSRFSDELISRLRADGIEPTEMRMVIATHSHPDHIEAIARFAEMDIPVGIHPAAADYLEQVGDLIYQFLASDVPDFTADHELVEGPIAALDGLIEVVHTPGHEPGSICLHWPEEKTLVTGDLVFAGGVGRTDFPGGDHEALMRSISRVSELDVEHVLPGHGSIISGRDAVRANYERVLGMYA